ncbi:MAG: G8 domain-containing protein [Pseudomonadota bacterium]
MDRVTHTELGSEVIEDAAGFVSADGDLTDTVSGPGDQNDAMQSDALSDVAESFDTDSAIGGPSPAPAAAPDPDDVAVFSNADGEALADKLRASNGQDDDTERAEAAPVIDDAVSSDAAPGAATSHVADRFETDTAIRDTGSAPGPALDMAMGDMDDPGHDMTGDMVIEDNNAFLMAMGEGSRIEIHAADASKESWTQLSENAFAGQSVLRFTESTGWEVGDKIAIAASGQDYTEDEERTIVSISPDGKTVTLDQPLEFDHYGELETYRDGSNRWEVDMRAEVALLSRNVTIQGDEDSVVDGFGAHTMVMDGAEQYISGAEFYRVGQEDILGRYPIHWHMLGDASGQYVTNTSVHSSYQKGATVHGTSNTLFEDNVIFNHVGHGFFMEDGSETGNVVKDNLVFGTHASKTGEPIPTDRTDVSSYWIENVSNTFIGNHAAGSENVGFFIAPATQTGPHGMSEGMDVPNNANDFHFVGNTASSSEFGVFLDGHVDDETLEHVDGQNFSLDGSLWFIDTTTYANRDVGLWSFKGNASDNYVVVMDAKLADNASNLEVRGDDLLFVDSISIGESDNIAADKNVENIGVKTYRNSDAGMVDVFFTEFDNSNGDIAISLQEGELKDYGDNFYNISFGNVDNMLVFRDTTALLRPDDAFNTVARDDGSLTGVDGGAWITRNLPDEPQRSGYDSYIDPDLDNSWITIEGAMGVTEFYLYGTQADTNKVMTVTRSIDNLKFEQNLWMSRSNRGGEDLYQFITPTSDDQEAAFLVELGGPRNVFPTSFSLSLDGIRVGEAVVYEIPNVASFSTDFNVNEVSSMSELFAAGSTSAFVQGGSLFIRVVGMRADSESYLGASPDDQLFGEFMGTESRNGFAISFDVTRLNPSHVNYQRYGEATFDTNLERALAGTDGFVSTKPANTELILSEAPTAHAVHDSTSNTVVVTEDMARWSNSEAWGGEAPDASNILVVGEGMTIVIDQSATVKGIIVDGGNLIVEDAPGGSANAIKLVSDYVLVINGGLFQAGTETNPLDRDFTLELTGDDPEFDLHVTDILKGLVPNTLFATEVDLPVGNEFRGTSGDDFLRGTAGNDTLYGNGGNDTLHGIEGDDTAFGGQGNDNLQGGYGNDTLNGGQGDDYLAGSYDEDVVSGGAGNDEVYGDYGIDILFGNAGDDKVGGGDHDDTLYGGDGDDNLIGGIGTESGNDVLFGGAGADSLNGGAGNDVYVFESVLDSTAASRDTIQQFSAADDTIDVSALGITGLDQLTITLTASQTIVRHNASDFEVLIQGRHTLLDANFVFAEPPPPEAGLELGVVTVQTRPDQWHSVSFETAIADAVVVMGPISFNGNSATVTRVRNVTEDGFEFRLDEWNYLNDVHQSETISWMAVSAGSHRLADGSLIQAGYTSVSDEVPADITFGESFDDAPVVFGQVTTYNGGSTVTNRMSNVSETGLEIRMQEQEAADNLHNVETASWIAFDADTTVFDHAGTVDVDHEWAKVKTGEAPAADDVIIADMQSFNGSDPVALRYQDNAKGIKLHAQEETSEDDEVIHAVETAGFLMTEAGQYELIA